MVNSEIFSCIWWGEGENFQNLKSVNKISNPLKALSTLEYLGRNSITPESNIKDMRMWEIITHQKGSWLSNKFFQLGHREYLDNSMENMQ